MELGLDKLFCWQTVVFSFAIWAVTLTVRRVVEHSVPSALNKASGFYGWWNDILVPISPVIIGAILAGSISKTFPYPEGMQLLWGRLMFGVFCGLIGSKVYQIVWGVLKSKSTDDGTSVGS